MMKSDNDIGIFFNNDFKSNPCCEIPLEDSGGVTIIDPYYLVKEMQEEKIKDRKRKIDEILKDESD